MITPNAWSSSVIPAIVIVSWHKVPVTLELSSYEMDQGESEVTNTPLQQRFKFTREISLNVLLTSDPSCL